MVYNTYITSKEQFLKKSTDSFFAMLQEKGVGIDDAIRLLEKRKKELEALGYTANRNRGSFGNFDIVACNKQHFLLEKRVGERNTHHPCLHLFS